MRLLPFDPCDALEISGDVCRQRGVLEFTYDLGGGTGEIVIPPTAQTGRGRRLWSTTCFHAYVSIGKTSYLELHFSPSGEWSAYRYTGYRQGMREVELPLPAIRFTPSRLIASVELQSEAASGAQLGLAAAIEHKSGIRSYWALAHPRSNRPDFHARDCFVARLP